jgi:hypothetical protein
MVLAVLNLALEWREEKEERVGKQRKVTPQEALLQ